MKSKKEFCFNYNDKDYYVGDKVFVLIEGKFVEGVIQKEGEKLYICNNIKDGVRAKDTLGYKYSWAFSFTGDAFTDGVKFFNFSRKDIEAYNEKKGLYFEKIQGISSDKFKIYLKGETILAFNLKMYPECCGSNIIYDFKENLYNTTRHLSNEKNVVFWETLKNSLFIRTNTNAILKKDQFGAIKLIKLLGFEEINRFINKNTDNELIMYSKNV